jgi:hypothetical protein
VAELDPMGLTGRLFRRSPGRAGLEITLRTALCSCLPFEGGLPLHAAGVVAEGRGVVFFGPSGAGKSTLAALSPYPVLSDELVAVIAARPFALTASGFWGSGDEGRCREGAWPLAALVHLDKGPRLSLERLGWRRALARLVEVVMVPPAPLLWAPVLHVLGKVLQDIPVYRLTWALDHPPWTEIRERLLE